MQPFYNLISLIYKEHLKRGNKYENSKVGKKGKKGGW